MPTIRTLIFLVTLPMLAVIGGCSQDNNSGSGPVIATVNGESIRESELKEVLQAQFNTDKPRNEAERRQTIDWLVSRKLLVQEARKQKLDKRDDVQRAIRVNHDELLIRALTAQYLRDNPVTEQDTRVRYDELKKEREYKVSHILLPSEAEAKQAIAAIKKGASFAKLAKEKSLDADSAKRSGEIGWISKHVLAPQIYFAAVELKDGQMTETPVKSDYGWHIVKRNASRGIKLPPYDKVKDKMIELVHREKVSHLGKHLREKANVVVSSE